MDMKKIITFSIDDDLVKKLKKYQNKSDLVNDLLKRFFNNEEDALTARNETLVKMENDLYNIAKSIKDNNGLLLNLEEAIGYISYKLKESKKPANLSGIVKPVLEDT